MHSVTKQFLDTSQSARNGGVIRRSVETLERHDLLPEVIVEARKRGWHVLETGGQIVVLCHEGAVTIHC